MKTRCFVKFMAVGLATLNLCLPQAVFALEAVPTPPVVDVALSDGGVLHGRLVDLEGANVAGVPVAVQSQNQTVSQVTTAADGKFTVSGLRGGVYQVAAGEGRGIYRLWSAGTAPPVAQNDAIIYTQNGMQPMGPWKMLLSNPIVIAGAVATAIAVPIALCNSGSSSP